MLFRRLYELKAEEATRGGAPVVVVGPPGAGKTTFIEILRSRGVEAAEEAAGLAPGAEEARGGGRRKRTVRLLKGLAGGGYVSRDRVEKELAGEPLKETHTPLPPVSSPRLLCPGRQTRGLLSRLNAAASENFDEGRLSSAGRPHHNHRCSASRCLLGLKLVEAAEEHVYKLSYRNYKIYNL